MCVLDQWLICVFVRMFGCTPVLVLIDACVVIGECVGLLFVWWGLFYFCSGNLLCSCFLVLDWVIVFSVLCSLIVFVL